MDSNFKKDGGLEKAQTTKINVEALKKGIANLEKHIENIKQFNLPYVIAINKFYTGVSEMARKV